MRRLVLEIPRRDFLKLHGDIPLQKVKSVEVLQFLRHDPDEFAVISKIELADAERRIEDVVRGIRDAHAGGAEIHVLERSRGNTFLCFMKGRPPMSPAWFGPRSAGGYLTTPFELRNGKLRLTILGGLRELRGLMGNLKRAKVRFRVASLTDAKFSPDSPLSHLTEKQRRVLIAAYDLGYYDRPRRIGSEQLAKRLNLARSTLVVHRLKAERRLLAAVLDELRQ